MKRIWFPAVFATIVAALLSSCLQEPSSLVDVALAVSEPKWLEAEIDTETAEYRYTAVPLFTLEEPSEIYGTVLEEKSIGEHYGVSLGMFTAGRWRFHVYAYNRSGSLIREGETEVYLRRTQDGVFNLVPVTLVQSTSRKGSVHFSFETNAASLDGGYVEVSWQPNGGVWTDPVRMHPSESSTETNLSKYDFTLSDLQAGTYMFKVDLYDSGVRLGGSALSTYILDNATTEVTGTVYPAEHVLGAFRIEIPPAIVGSIGPRIEGMVGGSYEFSWRPVSGEPARYVWRMDGDVVQDGVSDAWTWTADAPGCYTVTCTALSETGLEAGTSNCLLNVQSGRRQVYTSRWESPSDTKTMQYEGVLLPSSLVRVNARKDGTSLATTYLELEGSEPYSASVDLGEGRTLSFSISDGVLSMAPAGDMDGVSVLVEVSP